MRLWTWQKRGFSLADKESKVESPENSFYLNDPCKAEARCYSRAYKKLWEKLGTCQFHWYFTDEKEAKNEGTCRENCTNDRFS